MLAYSSFITRFWITLSNRKANKEEISNPPMGGMIPLKIFKYGSVIDVNADNIPLLQSMPGNQVSNILIIKRKQNDGRSYWLSLSEKFFQTFAVSNEYLAQIGGNKK